MSPYKKHLMLVKEAEEYLKKTLIGLTTTPEYWKFFRVKMDNEFILIMLVNSTIRIKGNNMWAEIHISSVIHEGIFGDNVPETCGYLINTLEDCKNMWGIIKSSNFLEVASIIQDNVFNKGVIK